MALDIGLVVGLRLGDRLGLGLYDNGSKAPLVKGSLILDDPESPLHQRPPAPAGAPESADPVQPAQATVKSPDAGAQRLQQALKVDPQSGEVK